MFLCFVIVVVLAIAIFIIIIVVVVHTKIVSVYTLFTLCFGFTIQGPQGPHGFPGTPGPKGQKVLCQIRFNQYFLCF